MLRCNFSLAPILSLLIAVEVAIRVTASEIIPGESAYTTFRPAWIADKNFFFHLEKEEEEEEEEEEVTQEEKENVKLHALVSVFQFIMKQSYICALIAMMVSTGNKTKQKCC